MDLYWQTPACVNYRSYFRRWVLVVGDQDILKLAGHDKSIKHRKAEQLIANGQNIKIIGESDFKKLVKTHETSSP